MKRSVFYKLLSMLLVFALLVELLPVSAFAAPDVEETPAAVQEELLPEIGNSESTEEQDIETPEGEEAQGNARVVGEITELREEGIKHFRMDDGSFIAVDYGMPVHFSTDGGESWEPIDNTLTLTAAETPTGEQDENSDSDAAVQKYFSENGNKRTSFARDLQSGFLFSAESGDHKICMALPISAGNRSETTGSENEEDVIDMTVELPTEDVEAAESPVSGEQEPSESAAAPAETASEETEDQDGLAVPMVMEEELGETAGDTATVEANAETNTAEAFNTAASAEVSYPQDQQKQPDRGNPEEENSNDYASRSLEEQVMPSRLTTDVLYRDVYDGVDLSYELCGYDVKENIIVKSRRDSYSFTFHLNTGDLVPIMQEDGSILFVDSEEQGIYLIPVPYMYDAEGVNSDAVSYSLTEAEDGMWALTVTANAEWINAKERLFPVEIDPSVFYYGSSNNNIIYTSYVNSGNTAASSYNKYHHIRCGDIQTTEYGNGHSIGLIYVNALPTIPTGGVVTNAQLGLYQTMYGYSDPGYS